MKALHNGFRNVIVSTISIDLMSWDGTEREEFAGPTPISYLKRTSANILQSIGNEFMNPALGAIQISAPPQIPRAGT